MSKLYVTVRLKIREGKLEGFKRQAAEIMSLVREKDKGTLQYDWFLSSDKTECEIREAYESSEAFMAHRANVREALIKLFEQFATDHTAVFLGDPSPQLLEAAKAMKGKMSWKVYSFLQGL